MKTRASIRWYLHRLRAMGPAEIGQRLHHKWLQQTEPAFLESLKGLQFESSPQASPPLPDKNRVPHGLRTRLAEEAHGLKAGHWCLFGWREVEVGSPPCWHRDPCSGVVVPPGIPSRKLNHRKLPDGADARSVWEVNRWAEITRLGMHAWLNGDLESLRIAQSWLLDWAEHNPPGLGINWTSPLEAAIRLMNLSWFDALVTAALESRADQNIRQMQAELVRRLVPAHAAWVWRYRSGGSSANNHLLGELAALAVAVSRWPVLESLACPALEAWERLEAELLCQFAPDGGSREQALHYHLFAFELAWLAARSVGCTGGAGWERLGRAAAFFVSLVHAGEPWDFGDNDDAQVLPLTGDRARAVGEWKAWMSGQDGPLRFWLGPPPEFDRAADGEPVRIFPDSGLGVIRQDGWQVRLDASPLGFGALAAHGHADALHLSIWDGAEALLIDPGTGGYYGYPQWRGPLAGWEAHNGPVPAAGFQTPVRMGPFLWTRHHTDPWLEKMPSGLRAGLAHEDYALTRTVEVRQDGIYVTDEEAGRKPFKVRFILSPQCQIIQEKSSRWRVERGGKAWHLQILEGGEIAAGGLAHVSSGYGAVHPAPSLSLEATTGKLRVIWSRAS